MKRATHNPGCMPAAKHHPAIPPAAATAQNTPLRAGSAGPAVTAITAVRAATGPHLSSPAPGRPNASSSAACLSSAAKNSETTGAASTRPPPSILPPSSGTLAALLTGEERSASTLQHATLLVHLGLRAAAARSRSSASVEGQLAAPPLPSSPSSSPSSSCRGGGTAVSFVLVRNRPPHCGDFMGWINQRSE